MEEIHEELQEVDNTFNKAFKPTYFNTKMFESNLDFLIEHEKYFSTQFEDKLKSMISTPEFSLIILSSFNELQNVNLNIDTKQYDAYEETDPFYPNFS